MNSVDFKGFLWAGISLRLGSGVMGRGNFCLETWEVSASGNGPGKALEDRGFGAAAGCLSVGCGVTALLSTLQGTCWVSLPLIIGICLMFTHFAKTCHFEITLLLLQCLCCLIMWYKLSTRYSSAAQHFIKLQGRLMSHLLSTFEAKHRRKSILP